MVRTGKSTLLTEWSKNRKEDMQLENSRSETHSQF